MGQIVIPLADGFEETEAITNIDVLRRAGLNVVTVSLGSLTVHGDHGIDVQADQNISDLDLDQVEGIVLPGGMPGAKHLKEDKRVVELVEKLDEEDGLVAAICAAPMVLEEAGVIEDRPATSYPGFDEQMPSCRYQQDRVVVDDNLVTGRGPGVALEFAIKIVELIVGQDKAEELKAAMITNF
ncbi:DJ-1 family glyoxalase III [Halanaerobacter jeridensis]|uniref:4-methyl-5(B-hydroxyethyl)-thiazole monophosphate biosynthesis n=1 Tax=Halanaerobacter jeridensis TaxID=706427 RepID=A0A939BQR4_9FIRM|nr:DJ-1 family glyoxalase III [Halanaerobacter jeridensis]MBM7556629.1 4-methyl-5(b-hydroxyethyl)-thiazole monophosphate biosynthesis [Halanaerobacter jeridensis]